MIFVWLVLGACGVYLLVLMLLWIWIAYTHSSHAVLLRALNVPVLLGPLAFNAQAMYRQITLHRVMGLASTTEAIAELERVFQLWIDLDYSVFNTLYVFGKADIESALNALRTLRNNIPNQDKEDGFTYLLNVLKHKDIGLSRPMSDALCGCIEEIRDKAFASNVAFSQPKHELNTIGSPSVLIHQICKHLEKMVSVNG